MAAITKTWTDIADANLNPDAPLTTTLMYALRDDLQFLHEWLGASFYAGAIQDHNHDGVNSAAIPIGQNSLRNGSFESSTSGWTLTQFTGGTIAIDTANAMDGTSCLAITSTLLANGGGQAQTSEYEAVVGGRYYAIRGMVKGSVANVSSKVEVVWFDSTKAQISTSIVYQSANTPTTAQDIWGEVQAPATARYKQLRLTGGVPGVGTATGTVYFDGYLATISTSGLVFLGEKTFSNVASIVLGTIAANVADIQFDWSLYDAIEIELLDLGPATNSVQLYGYVSEDGGATFKTAASYSMQGWSSAGATIAAYAPGTGGQWSITPLNQSSSSAYMMLSGRIIVADPSNTSHYKSLRACDMAYMNSSSVRTLAGCAGTWEGDLGAINGLKLAYNSGNVYTGTVRVYGRRKI